MAKFPRIQRTCPVKNALSDYMDGDVCRICDRQVFDLDSMSDSERMAFMSACKDEVCVSYKLPLRKVAAAVALSAMALPAAAQDTLLELDSGVGAYDELPKCAEDFDEIIIMVGGIKDPGNVEYIETAEDLETPELPVVYEEDA